MRTNKKLAVAAAVTGIIALGAGTAAAYWTTGGTGSGTGTAGSAVVEVDVDPVDVEDGIVPGGDVDVTATFTNTNATSSVFFKNITAVVDAAGDCDDTWFSIPAQNGLNITLAPGASYAYSAVLSMADTATNQDACKGGDIEVTLTASS